MPDEQTPTNAPVSSEPAPQSGEPREFTPETIDVFTSLSERGGFAEGIGGNEDFPDLPAVEAPGEPPAEAREAEVQVPPAGTTVPSPSTAPVVQPQVTPSPQPAPAPAPVVAQPQTPTPQGQAPAPAPTPQAVAPQPGPTPQVVDPFAQMANEIAKSEEQFITALAGQNYKISSEDHEAYLAGDTAKLSVLAARIHVGAVRSVMQTVSAYLPMVVNALVESGRENDKREARFWDMNKHLDPAKHRSLLPKVFQTYNGLNPGVDEETRFKAVGILVAQLHGIPLQVASPPPGQQLGAPAVRTPGKVVRQVEAPAFSPAGGGGAPPVGGVPNGGPKGAWDNFVDFAQAAERGAFDES